MRQGLLEDKLGDLGEVEEYGRANLVPPALFAVVLAPFVPFDVDRLVGEVFGRFLDLL